MKKIAAELCVDLIGLVGAGLIAHGAYLIYEPAGWVVAGAFLLFGATVLARPPKPSK